MNAIECRFAIVAARFNEEVVEKLLVGALGTMKQRGVLDESVDVIRVPGAFELPLAAKTLAESGRYVAVICLGAVIRGDTDHYDYICEAATKGIMRAGLDSGVPVIFGVLTCETEELALARAGGAHGNKGADAVLAAIEMAGVFRQISSKS